MLFEANGTSVETVMRAQHLCNFVPVNACNSKRNDGKLKTVLYTTLLVIEGTLVSVFFFRETKVKSMDRARVFLCSTDSIAKKLKLPLF